MRTALNQKHVAGRLKIRAVRFDSAPCAQDILRSMHVVPLVARLTFLLAIAAPACAGTVTGLVVGVADADIVTILDSDHHQDKIRLAGTHRRSARLSGNDQSKA